MLKTSKYGRTNYKSCKLIFDFVLNLRKFHEVLAGDGRLEYAQRFDLNQSFAINFFSGAN